MSEPLSFLRCRLAEGSVALALAAVRGLEGIDRLQRLPRPGPLAGWLLGAEDEVPVYDLSVLLGLPPARSGSETTVVLYGCEAVARGLLVAAASRFEAGGAALLARPRLLDRPDLGAWVGAIALEGELVPWLDPSPLHSDLAPCGSPHGAAALGARRPLPPPPSAPARAIVTFEAGSTFALSLSQVVEVVDLGAPVPLPGGPGFLLGLIEWRGRAVPVVDLSLALGELSIPSIPSGAPRRALIARTLDPTDCIALAVSGEIKMRRLPLVCRLVEAPERVARQAPRAVLGIAELDGGTVLIPDLEHILSTGYEGFGWAA